MTRFTIGDAAELAGDVGPDPRLIGVLIELGQRVELAAIRDRMERCLTEQPILSLRFVRHGRAPWTTTWQSVPVNVADHVHEAVVDDPVEATQRLMVLALTENVPPWRLVVLRAPSGNQLLFYAHHVLLDGLTAMAVLGPLLGAPRSRTPGPTAPHLPGAGPLAGLARGSSRTSLLAPIRSGFRLASVTADLAPLVHVARAAGATVNDVVLLAVAEALRAVAAEGGERLRRVVVSVPVPSRRISGAGRNQVGAFVVGVPERGPGDTDATVLAAMAARTRWRKRLARGSSGAPALSYLLALLGYLGWYRPLFEGQHAITTLLTNLRGPPDPLQVCGAPVLSLTPVSPALGNVTVVFAAISYAGRLRITARLDRTRWPDEAVLTEALSSTLARLVEDGVVEHTFAGGARGAGRGSS